MYLKGVPLSCRYLGSGCTYTELHYLFRIGVTTASLIVPNTCRVLWTALNNDVFPQFSEEFWRHTAEAFKKNLHFPHCLGAIDGKHVRIIKPEHSESLSYSSKKFFSVGLLAVVDSNYHFLYIDVSEYGKDSDTTIFKNSTFCKSLEEESLNIPAREKLTEDSMPLPYVFLGDEAFGMSVNMMRPYPGNHLTRKQKIFNYRLCRARRCVECAFGILTNKWRIFSKPINLKLSNCVAVIKACCALHNYVREKDGIRFEETLEINGLYDEDGSDCILERGRKSAYAYRDAFANFFCSPAGSVPWQDSKI